MRQATRMTTKFWHKAVVGLSLSAVLLAGCSSKPVDSADDSVYFKSIEQAAAKLAPIDAITRNSKVTRQRFRMTLNEHAPEAKKALDIYEGTPMAQRDSFQALKRAHDNFNLAGELWDQDKGLSLVNQRLADGSRWLSQVPSLISQEKGKQ